MKIKIVFIGDSITYGTYNNVPNDSIFINLVKRSLLLFRYDAQVVNMGTPGETSVGGLQKMSRILELKPDIAVIMYGSNDSFINEGDTCENVAVNIYRRNLENMISQLREAGIGVVLMSPPPLGSFADPLPEPYHTQGINFYLKPYIATCREIAFNHSISIVDHFQDWIDKKETGTDYNFWLEDGVHPNSQGHRQMALLMIPAILRECVEEPVDIDFITGGKIKDVFIPGNDPEKLNNAIGIEGANNDLFAGWMPSKGDFAIHTDFRIVKPNAAGLIFRIGKSDLLIDVMMNRIILKGEMSGNKSFSLPCPADLASEKSIQLEIKYKGNNISILINKSLLYSSPYYGNISGNIGFVPGLTRLEIFDFSANGSLVRIPVRSKLYTIPFIDLSKDYFRQCVVDKEKSKYLGHVTTIITTNGEIHAFYPQGHGRGAIVHKKSSDGGMSWSDRLKVPENFAGSLEVPTIFGIPKTTGSVRYVIFSGQYPIRYAVSEDMCNTFTDLKPVFNYGGIVAMSDMIRLKNGSYMAFFHDDGKHFKQEGRKTNEFTVFKTLSYDEGLSWSVPEVVIIHKSAHLCEAGTVRSPDGNTIAILLRENSRTYNSMVSFSRDEGITWSDPVELPASLTGDRHTIRYAKDGRLVIVFRDQAEMSPYKGDFVAWVGTWDDIINGSEGQYRIRLLDNTWEYDCGYAGLELLPDGTFVSTTYGHWDEGESPYIRCIRFKLDETDKMIEEK